MKLLTVLRNPNYFLLALIAALASLLLYTYLHLLGIIENLGVWMASIPLLNGILLVIFSALFGAALSYQIFVWQEPNVCSAHKKIKSGATTSIGTIAGFLVAQCPACASFTSLLLPASAAGFFLEYSVPLSVLSILLLIFTLHYLGAFQKTEKIETSELNSKIPKNK